MTPANESLYDALLSHIYNLLIHKLPGTSIWMSIFFKITIAGLLDRQMDGNPDRQVSQIYL